MPIRTFAEHDQKSQVAAVFECTVYGLMSSYFPVLVSHLCFSALIVGVVAVLVVWTDGFWSFFSLYHGELLVLGCFCKTLSLSSFFMDYIFFTDVLSLEMMNLWFYNISLYWCFITILLAFLKLPFHTLDLSSISSLNFTGIE